MRFHPVPLLVVVMFVLYAFMVKASGPQQYSCDDVVLIQTDGADLLRIFRETSGHDTPESDGEDDCLLSIPVFSQKQVKIDISETPELSSGGDFRYELSGTFTRAQEKGFFTVENSGRQKSADEISRLSGVATATFPIYTFNGNLTTLHPKAGKKLFQIPAEKVAVYTASRKVIRNEWASGSSWAYSAGGSEPYRCGGLNTYRMGGSPADYFRWRVYMKFDLSAIPANSIVSDAYIFVKDMREHGWSAERSASGTPLDKTVAIASSEPVSFTAIDAFPLSKTGQNYSLGMPTVDPWGIPGKSDIKNQKACVIGLKDDIKAWMAGTVPNKGLVLNALPLSQVNPSYPGYNMGNPMKECYFEDIFTDKTFLVVEVDTPPEPVEITAISSPWPDKVDLLWQESTSNSFYCYKIFRKTAPGVDVTSPVVATIGRIKDVSYTDNTNLSPDTTYYYRVAVYNAARLYALSGEKSVKTPDYPTEVVLSYMGNGMQYIDLEWTKNTDTDFAKYVVYWYYNSNVTTSSSVAAEITDAEITSLRVSNLGSNSSYYFAVFVYNTAGVYKTSNVIRGDTLPYSPPIAPVISAVTKPMKVGISWAPVSHELFGSYQIFRSNNPGVTSMNQLVCFTSEVGLGHYTDEVTVGGVAYYYTMYVYDLTANVPNYSISNEISATPPTE